MKPQTTFSSRSSRTSIFRRAAASVGALVLVLLAALSVGPSVRPAIATGTIADCRMPPRCGSSSAPVRRRRSVSRSRVPGSSSRSGAALPAHYRAKGAATTFFVLNLPPYVGQPATPWDPATVVPEADQLYQAAVASTACARPWIALNELLGPTAATPWSPTTTQYRANILALVQRLAIVVPVPASSCTATRTLRAMRAHGGRASDGTRRSSTKSYYNAANIRQLGPVIGNRRMRLGMREHRAPVRRGGRPRGAARLHDGLPRRARYGRPGRAPTARGVVQGREVGGADRAPTSPATSGSRRSGPGAGPCSGRRAPTPTSRLQRVCTSGPGTLLCVTALLSPAPRSTRR